MSALEWGMLWAPVAVAMINMVGSVLHSWIRAAYHINEVNGHQTLIPTTPAAAEPKTQAGGADPPARPRP